MAAALQRQRGQGLWKGFAIEQIIQDFKMCGPYFWATRAGAESDFLAAISRRRYGLECKYADLPARLNKSIAKFGLPVCIERLESFCHNLKEAPDREPYLKRNKPKRLYQAINKRRHRCNDGNIAGGSPRRSRRKPKAQLCLHQH
ncbi:MAG: DUF4143 domain-containing protein [Candidatus Sumerlaeia bacterium]|nr:DUF4143 domain-containing protein [Candidatus Sumerlaeia bacterium]